MPIQSAMSTQKHDGYERIIGMVVIALLLGWTSTARADCRRRWPWTGASALGTQLTRDLDPLTAAGVLAPPLAGALLPIDHGVRVLTQDGLGGRYDVERLSLAAPYLLTLGALGWLAVSQMSGRCVDAGLASEGVAALGWTALAVGALKWTTGRGWPNGGLDPNRSDRLSHPEHAQRWEPFENGLAAWPSGHAATAFAVARVVVEHARRPLWQGVAVGVASVVALAMLWNDHHWLSDIVSGAFLGWWIGGAVVRSQHQVRPMPDRMGGIDDASSLMTTDDGVPTLQQE